MNDGKHSVRVQCVYVILLERNTLSDQETRPTRTLKIAGFVSMVIHQISILELRVRFSYPAQKLWVAMYQGFGEKHLQCFCVGFDSLAIHNKNKRVSYNGSESNIISGFHPEE
jgi:hypothetical protein